MVSGVSLVHTQVALDVAKPAHIAGVRVLSANAVSVSGMFRP
jgi:hypothetical protein